MGVNAAYPPASPLTPPSPPPRPPPNLQVLNVVVGVNDDKLTAEHTICTAASCTTNCIAPVIQVVLKELGIEKGMITTVRGGEGVGGVGGDPNSRRCCI